ncbi:Zinc finger RING-type domain containing protein [Klebsormidium nitens]|uniref:Zinc finger RING-type domain containing protein n=1 Tax=Klebsormidium nitens TaxID=105231 RepID=A0A1Y1IBT2_KLENI|nr:Zinc finger RING-type domain containing protein [Klebsormidium nitens]|eukprot:GAQ88370.1 Zinc finger RING-type domain containing protein [Klebsormidium nitens]
MAHHERIYQRGTRDPLAERARLEGEAAAEWTVSIFRMIRDLLTSSARIFGILFGAEDAREPQQARAPPPPPEQLAVAAGKAAAEETVALVRKAGRLIRFVLPSGTAPRGFALPNVYQGAALDLARLAEKALALSRDTVDELDTWAGHVSVELIDELQGLRNEEARERAAEAIEMLGDWAFEALIVALNRVVDDLARRNLLRTYSVADRAAAPAATEREDDAVSPSEACVICYQRARRAVFLYCGHRAACMTCATAVAAGPRRACPLCRQMIHGVVRVFDP